MQKLATVSAIALLTISTTAREQANATQPTPLPRAHCYNYGVTDWSGFYAGAHLGVGFHDDAQSLSVQGGGGGGGGGALGLDGTSIVTRESAAGGGGGGGNGALGGDGLEYTESGTTVPISGNGGDKNGGGGGAGQRTVPGFDGNSNTGSGGDGFGGVVTSTGGNLGMDGQGGGGGGSEASVGDVGGNGGPGGGGGGAGGGNGGGVTAAGGGGGGNGGIASVSTSNRAFLTGMHAGYNWQCGRLLLGVESDWTTVNEADSYLATLRARAGIVRGRHLFYVTAGLAWTRLQRDSRLQGITAGGGSGGNRGQFRENGEFTTSARGRGFFDGGRGGLGAPSSNDEPASGITRNGNAPSATEFGFVVGGGLETRLSHSASIGIEALYYGFKSGDSAIDADQFVVRGRLTKHFSRHSAYKTAIPDWSGLYIGVNGGGIFGLGEGLSDVALANGQSGGRGGVPLANSYDTPGGGAGAAAALAIDNAAPFLGGIHLGRNWQRGHWIFGLEGELNAVEDRFDYLGTVRGRIGLARDQSLFYITAGLAFADLSSETKGGLVRVSSGEDGNHGTVVAVGVDANNFGQGGAGGTASFEPNSNDGGVDTALVLGAGMEVKLRDNLSLGIEGLYYFFDDTEAVHAYIDDEKIGTYGDDDGFYTVKARLTYHFGHREQEGAGELEPLK